MKWNQFRLKTTTEAEDIVSSMLADLGIEGVQIEDKIPLTQSDKEQMFVDILPDMPEDDGCAYLTFYLDEEVDKHEMLLKVRQELEEMRSYLNVGDCTIEESQTEDVDWVNNWKQYFHQFYIDDILVIPSWENVEAKDSDKMVIHIDPGTAFGTGMHETTQLCIRQLKKYVTEDTEILDVGCGSGILGMLALKFGAKHSVGTDLDPCAIDATYENMDNNGISRDQYEVMIGNIIDDKEVQDKVGYEKYDIVAANILADVLVPLTPVIIHQLKKGGIYITSGIIEDKEEVVVEAVKKAGLEVLEVEPLPFGADQPAGFRHRNVLFGRSDLRRDNQCRRILREICSDIVSERRASPAAAVIAAGAATLQKPLGITEPGDIVSHGQCSAMVFCGISK